LDFIRAVATIIIVVYHFNCNFQIFNINGFNGLFYKYANGNWGEYIGVTLFFMISGAALMYNYSDKIEPKTYIIKRFKSIYPMFWTAYFIVFLYDLCIYKTIPQIPKIKFLLTLIGVDGYFFYLSPNFYKIGEWFLGAIIFIYIVFPICRYLIKKNKKNAIQTLVIFGVIKYLLLLFYPFNIEPTRNIIVCIFTFMLGMYFVEYIKEVKLYQAVVALGLFMVLIFVKMPIDSYIILSIPGVLLFIILVYISKHFTDIRIRKPFEILSKHSYAIFLVHHVVIQKIEHRFSGMYLDNIEVFYMFYACVIITAVLAKLLFELTNYILKNTEEKIMLKIKSKKEKLNGKV